MIASSTLRTSGSACSATLLMVRNDELMEAVALARGVAFMMEAGSLIFCPTMLLISES